ncbi:MAG: hypothetical protein Alpg2KO_21830 [Alphaproteobacteria bacterium]
MPGGDVKNGQMNKQSQTCGSMILGKKKAAPKPGRQEQDNLRESLKCGAVPYPAGESGVGQDGRLMRHMGRVGLA